MARNPTTPRPSEGSSAEHLIANRFILPRPYLSASQIAMYLRCPMQYEFAYVKNLRQPPAIVMMVGSGVHGGLELYYKDRLTGQEPLRPEQIAEFSISEFEAEAEDKEVICIGAEKDEAVSGIKNAVIPYVTHVGPLITPVDVEFEFRYESQCGIQVLGYVDLERKPFKCEAAKFTKEQRKAISLSGIENRLVDHKITAKKWSLDNLQNALQFHLYAMGTGKLNVEIHNATKSAKNNAHTQKKADFLEGIQDITQNIRLIRHTFEPRYFPHVETMIERVAIGITQGNFPPCDMGSWACSDKFCGYWSRCRGKILI